MTRIDVALLDLWKHDRGQITEKRLQQLIAFAGEGKLLDDNETSYELRGLLSIVPSDLIGQWIDECLTDRFSDFGFVLQDLVNEIGKRLGFAVTPGVYRGRSGGDGFDGLWVLGTECAIVVESKSSTAYSISLSTIMNYRQQVHDSHSIPLENISVLLVVGRDSTDDLEAQVRGSQFAWDIRLLGVDSLYRLLKLKESLDDPNVEQQIKGILVPQEFTRLDRIVDLVFATAEDALSSEHQTPDDYSATEQAREKPASFHDLVLPSLEAHFETSLIREARVLWLSADESTLISCQVSKEYDRSGRHFWYGLKRTTKERLAGHANAYCAYGLGTSNRVLLVPFQRIESMLSQCITSLNPDGSVLHWHLRFWLNETGVEIRLAEDGAVDMTEYLLESS